MQYVRDGKVLNLPKKWKFEKEHHDEEGEIVIEPGMKTGNFDLVAADVLLTEGFLPVTVTNNEAYDPEIQVRTGPTITENADHAVLDYAVTDKDLLEVQEAKKEKVKLEGRQIFKAKWDLEYKLMDMYDADELTQLEADKETLFTHYKSVIEPLIDAAGSPLAVKNVTYTWPSI